MATANRSKGSADASKPRVGFYCSEEDPAKGVMPELGDGPIIASVISPETFEAALSAPTRTLYLLIGNPMTVPHYLKRISEQGKFGIVNLDFLEGLARDRSAVEFLAAYGAAGIVSTRVETLKAAKGLGLKTVQRCFAIDHAAVSVTQKSLTMFHPDAVEVLPAMVAPRVGPQFREVHPGLTIVAGGLIESVKEIEDILASGVNAISTSNSRLWLI